MKRNGLLFFKASRFLLQWNGFELGSSFPRGITLSTGHLAERFTAVEEPFHPTGRSAGGLSLLFYPVDPLSSFALNAIIEPR